MKKIGFAMLVTRDGDKLRARPMSAYLERDENAIYFLTDARRHKDEEIARNPACQSVVRRRRAARNTFRSPARRRFPTIAPRSRSCSRRRRRRGGTSAEDPNIRVLKISPDDAEFWDSPGSVISYVKMAAAAATGTRPDLGDNRKVAM